jgi:glycosyltransferase involved in cell wall biosynthesis
MKIAFLNIYQNSTYRGVETFIDELASRLSTKHKVDIIVGNRKVPGRWPILWRTFCDPQGLVIAGFTLRNLKRIWKEKYDVVIPTNGGWQPAFIRLITWLYGGKMLISGHSGMGWDDRNNLWSFPNVFIALSKKAEVWAKKVNPLIKVVKIPNGVDLKKFKPNGQKIRVGLKPPVILCVGALTKTKRIDLTIKAVNKLNNVSLLVAAGGGDREKEITSLGKKLLGDRFKIIKVPYREIPKLYRSVDLFTLASDPYYSFEIVLIEAMATNLPVVANRDEIRREIVGRAGILVDPENTEAYAIALENALKLRWGRRPLLQARKFDWDEIAAAYEGILHSWTK